jgi:hypothetical protein
MQGVTSRRQLSCRCIFICFHGSATIIDFMYPVLVFWPCCNTNKIVAPLDAEATLCIIFPFFKKKYPNVMNKSFGSIYIYKYTIFNVQDMVQKTPSRNREHLRCYFQRLCSYLRWKTNKLDALLFYKTTFIFYGFTFISTCTRIFLLDLYNNYTN